MSEQILKQNLAAIEAAEKVRKYKMPDGHNGLPIVSTYDNEQTGERESYFDGRLTAIWDRAHLEKYPWGTFGPLPNGFTREGKLLVPL